MSVQIEKNKSLKAFNTFGIEATAPYFCEVTSVADLQEVLQQERFHNMPLLILGGGSNLLFTRDPQGLVLLNRIRGIEVVKEDEESVWLRVGAGENWHDFVLYTIAQGLAGLENLSLIPGTVGAAPMQNIGAYGVEIKDTFRQLEAVDCSTGQLRIFEGQECEFGYRSSIFKTWAKDRYIIASVTFSLHKKPNFNTSYGDIQKTLAELGIQELSLKAVSDAVIRIRQSKLPDPRQIGNAGSFFKNPVISQQQFEELHQHYPAMPHYPQEGGQVKVPAGWLIEQCGWKGHRRGAVGVHDRQALVLVNHGGAGGSEIRQLSEDIQASVAEKFGIALETEVNFV
ncbi:UDP-N-acetylmuramate dehydrogenase [Cesiribacter andamanensis]|uniref:UDP-N-acetylenolpyruvoylglucosamine reductase n=1 Tax=Cesiribacter andamanensis AMV16 TaxID=1279009 RepID=M7N459_9BACT|nr:UDP-N-acetylmuramate dehydrogenase [Cesiribacter andamanensis]EMR03458.1 UDP-N-acetylenolpyruvoylglucosamine reductase [Cesiribacter andamanensis AMV16]